ncbi:MAG TPA: ATP-binding cassette domain-containing protein [Acidimicrobiales bacterium]|nr:ATP-binding cassette domain-containing protein [Acidimicrobiales bacterium]
MSATPASHPVVGLAGVTKRFRRGREVVHAIEAVTFDLREGELVVLVGPSGSGKSTLLNLLAGWEAPDEGALCWSPTLSDAPASDRPWSEVALVPQALGLVDDLSVRENVALPLRLAGLRRAERDARALGLLERFGLAALRDRLPAETSLGEQQRAALARALVVTPRLLLADEPTAHQDAAWTEAVLVAIREAAHAGTACLVATHNPDAVPVADRLLSMRDGRLVETPSRLTGK